MKLGELKSKKILILGFGREGQDTFLFLRKLFPKKILGIADIKYKIQDTRYEIQNVKWHLGRDYLKALKDYDIVIKSPGIPFKILPKLALKKIVTQTDIFFNNCPGKIVGITGTKGKSTTASLIYKILKQWGLKVHLVGNIGKPVLNLLFSATPKDIYVYELSSHQLYNLKKSPQIAIFLNIYPEHLDYYRDFKEYLWAKQNIVRYQTKEDYFIYNSNDINVRETAKLTKAKKIPISSKVDVEFFDTCRKSQLIGEFNFLNMAAAIEVGKIFQVPKEKIIKAVKNFKPLPHRLELVGTFKGITFYNDALSTIPETAILAMTTLGKRVQTIFLGGFDRKIDFKKLAKSVLENKNIKNIILFPTTGEKIWKEILKFSGEQFSVNLPRHFFVDNMRDAVRLAYQHTQKGKICLLSCASTSFSIFRDYKEKGNLFKKYVKKFAKK